MTSRRFRIGFLLAALVPLLTAAPGARYLDEIFARAGVVKDLVYGQSALPDGKHQELLLDLYQPEGDAETKRAAIVEYLGPAWSLGKNCKPKD